MAVIPYELTALGDKYKQLESYIFEAKEERALPLAEELRVEMERLDIYTGRVVLLYGEMVRAMRRDAWPEAGRYYSLLGFAITEEIERMMKMASSPPPEPSPQRDAMFEHVSDIEELSTGGQALYEREKEIVGESTFPDEAVQRINREMGYNAAYKFLYYYYVDQDISLRELGLVLGKRLAFATSMLRVAGITPRPRGIPPYLSRLGEVGEPSKRILINNEWFWSVVVVPDPTFAYYYGCAVGDGSVDRMGKRVNVIVGVRKREGREFYDKLLAVCRKVGIKYGGKVTPRFFRIRPDGTMEYVETLEQAEGVDIYWTNAVVARLIKLFGEFRWDNLEWMLERRELAAPLIAGYWDADGYIAKEMKRILLSSSDRKLLETVGRYLLEHWGIETTLRGPYTARHKRAYKGVVEEVEGIEYELFVPKEHHPRFVEFIGAHMKYPMKRDRMGLSPNPPEIPEFEITYSKTWSEVRRARSLEDAKFWAGRYAKGLTADVVSVEPYPGSHSPELPPRGYGLEVGRAAERRRVVPRTELERAVRHELLELTKREYAEHKDAIIKMMVEKDYPREVVEAQLGELIADPPETPYPLIRTIEGELWEDFKYFFYEDRAELWGSEVLKPHGIEYRIYRVDDVWALGVRHDPFRLTYEKAKRAALLVPPS